MDENFEHAYDFTSKWEGGLDDDPRDPGGITKYGVCLKFLQDFYRQHSSYLSSIGILGPVDRETVRGLTRGQAKKIFRYEFWERNHCEDIAKSSPRLAETFFDTSVNIGKVQAAKLLQRAVGAKDDGVVGPKTIAAVRDTGDFMAAAALIELRKTYYVKVVDRRPASKCFMKGWLNRCNDLALEVSK